MPTRPASWVAQSGLPTSEANAFIQEEGSAAYIHTRLINESSTKLTDPPWENAMGQLMRRA